MGSDPELENCIDKSEINRKVDQKVSSDLEQENYDQENDDYIIEKRPYKCMFDGCDKSFTNPAYLKRHQKIHIMPSVKYICDICSLEVSTSSNLSRHHKNVHNVNNKSKIQVVSSKKKKYMCTVVGCNASFPRPSKLKVHLNVHNEKRPYKCTFDECDKSYMNPSHLKRHQQIHIISSTNYICKICSAEISTASNLKRHYKRAHDEQKMYCQECGISFRKKNIFEIHMAAHQNCMYKCEKCDRIFVTYAKLKKHQEKYNKIYKCPVESCSKIFNKWAAMVKHKKNDHISEYSCSVCSKTFSTKSTMKAHQMSHKDEAIPCPYQNCSRIYYHKRNLNQHIRVKHAGNKFHCDLCNSTFTTKQSIENHMVRVHLSENKPIKRVRKATKMPRKDKGLPKKSALSEIAGIEFSVHAEMTLINRVPTALLRDKAVEDIVSSFSEDDRASDFSVKGS